MQPSDNQGFRLLRADASALGGYLAGPIARTLPTLAPVSLPAVGGFTMARSEAFTADEIVSCSSAYARVSGSEQPDGSGSILVTAVIEDLNLLEVVRAQRVVAQIAIALPPDGGAIRISLAGCGFERLTLAGQACTPKFNVGLQEPGDDRGCCGGLTWEDVQRAGRTQGERLLAGFKSHSEEAHQWALSHYRRMTSDPQTAGGGRWAQASVVDGLEVSGAGRSCGHILEIPRFGRIVFGELLISRDAVQLVGIRADLGCGTKGRISILCLGGGNSPDD
jgi:hypothetical protein